MSLSKKIARKFVLPGMVFLGLDKYFLKKTDKNCCIINFHGVRKTSLNVFNNRHIPEAEFEKIIKYLSVNYKIVSLKEIFEIHRSKKKCSKKTIALTFDDGYKNNFDIAFPILKKYNVPATFYLISKGLVNKDFLVWPDIIDLIKKNINEDVMVEGRVFKYPAFYDQENEIELLNYLKTLGDRTENVVLDLYKKYPTVKKEIEKVPELVQLIDKEGLKKHIDESLLEFGSHTHTHFNLEYLSELKCVEELNLSRSLIEGITGRKLVSIAYPDGSYTNETNRIALAEGYTNIVAVEYKFNENNNNPNLLSRFTISNSTTFESNMIRLAKTFDKYGFC